MQTEKNYDWSPLGWRKSLCFALLLVLVGSAARGEDLSDTRPVHSQNAPFISPQSPPSDGPSQESLPNKQKKLFEGLEFAPYGSNEPKLEPAPRKVGINPNQTDELWKGKKRQALDSGAHGPKKSAAIIDEENAGAVRSRSKKRIPWELEEIPKNPTQPKILGAESEPKNYFTCGRRFEYRGKVLPCDSYIRQDGNGLKKIFSNVPEAREHLESYQSSWKSLKPYGYVGALGIGLMLGSMFVPKVKDEKGNEVRSQLSKSMLLGGTIIFGTTLTVGFTQMAFRERHLNRAVEAYNVANPADQIKMGVQVEVEL